MTKHHLDRLKELAERIRLNQRGPSHRLHIKARIEDADALEAAIAKLENHVDLCTCGAIAAGDVFHEASCDAVCGGEAGGA